MITPAKKKADDEPDLKKTLVTVWESDDGATVEVNTGRKKPKADGDQSVQASLPDTTGGSAEVDGSETDVDLAAAVALVSASNGNAAGLLKALTGQLTATKAEIVSLKGERTALLALVNTAMEGTAKLIARIGELPAGRKTVEYPEIQKDFVDLQDIYSEDVIKLIRKNNRS